MSQIERSQSDPTAWWWYYGQTAAQVGQLVTQNNARIVDIQVQSVSSSGPVFTVSMVSNTGAYAKQWWWYYNQTAQELSTTLQQLNARLISISPYQAGPSQLLFAAAMVANSGADSKQWWWWYGTPTLVQNSLKTVPARAVDLESYTYNGTTDYAVIAIANEGADASPWWWWFDVSSAEVSAELTQNQSQLLTLCNDGSGFDATMQAPSSAEWWYYLGVDGQAVAENLAQNGARATMVRTYPGPTFDVVMINNSDAYVTRIGNILRGNGAGWFGFVLKQVGGPLIGALNDQRVFEPASCIKIVIAVYAMQQVQNGSASLSEWVPLLNLNEPEYCVNQQMSLGTGDGKTTTFTGSLILASANSAPLLPGSVQITAGPVSATDNGTGALAGSGVLAGTINYSTGQVSVTFQTAPTSGTQVLVFESLQSAITQMMQNSDDARTVMLMYRYGIATLNGFAQSIGMPNTNFNGYVNCPGNVAYMTVDDGIQIYEGLASTTLLSSSNVQLLFSMMAGKNWDYSGIWASLQQIIQQEATPFGLSAAQITSFEDGIQLSQKSGGATWSSPNTQIDGNPVYSTGGNVGWVQIPSCSGGKLISTQYVFGFLGENTIPNANTWNAMDAGAEILRETVRAALSTWSQCG